MYNNKLLIIAFFGIASFIINLSFLSLGNNGVGNNDFLYGSLLFGLIGMAFLYSWYFLFLKMRKINNKIVKPLVIILVILGTILNFKYGGTSVRIENIWIGIFSEPIMWLLIASLIGHLILFIYKRNNPQIA